MIREPTTRQWKNPKMQKTLLFRDLQLGGPPKTQPIGGLTAQGKWLAEV